MADSGEAGCPGWLGVGELRVVCLKSQFSTCPYIINSVVGKTLLGLTNNRLGFLEMFIGRLGVDILLGMHYIKAMSNSWRGI